MDERIWRGRMFRFGLVIATRIKYVHFGAFASRNTKQGSNKNKKPKIDENADLGQSTSHHLLVFPIASACIFSGCFPERRLGS